MWQAAGDAGASPAGEEQFLEADGAQFSPADALVLQDTQVSWAHASSCWEA